MGASLSTVAQMAEEIAEASPRPVAQAAAEETAKASPRMVAQAAAEDIAEAPP